MNTTPEQKEIFARLTASFQRINGELEELKVRNKSTENRYKELQSTFDEQNAMLKRYEDTFGPLDKASVTAPLAPLAPAWPANQAPVTQSPAGVPSMPLMQPGMPSNFPPSNANQALKEKVIRELKNVFSYEVTHVILNKLFD